MMALRLYAVLDPLSIVPLYISISSPLPEEKRKLMLRRALTFVLAVLSLIAVTGDAVFKALGVKLSSFKVGGGLLLLVLAIDELGKGPRTKELVSEDVMALALVPLATPLLVGPGSITMILMFTIDHSPLEVVAAVLIACGATYVTLRASSIVRKILGESGTLALGRFMAIILAAYAAEMIHSGLVDWGLCGC